MRIPEHWRVVLMTMLFWLSAVGAVLSTVHDSLLGAVASAAACLAGAVWVSRS